MKGLADTVDPSDVLRRGEVVGDEREELGREREQAGGRGVDMVGETEQVKMVATSEL